MPRPCDSGRVDLNQVFMHMQRRMLSHLEVGSALEHASTCGAASEAHCETTPDTINAGKSKVSPEETISLTCGGPVRQSPFGYNRHSPGAANRRSSQWTAS